MSLPPQTFDIVKCNHVPRSSLIDCLLCLQPALQGGRDPLPRRHGAQDAAGGSTAVGSCFGSTDRGLPTIPEASRVATATSSSGLCASGCNRCSERELHGLSSNQCRQHSERRASGFEALRRCGLQLQPCTSCSDGRGQTGRGRA
jgi:hypothetical protein